MLNAPEKKYCYSNAIHYKNDCSSATQPIGMQSNPFVEELLRQHWLHNTEESLNRTDRSESFIVAKEKAKNLLQRTKLRAIARLSGAA
jgi:hypothetical protein